RRVLFRSSPPRNTAESSTWNFRFRRASEFMQAYNPDRQAIRQNGTWDMALLRTEIYQPSDLSVYGDSLDVDDADVASHRLPRLIVGALLGLAAVTTLVWFGYERSMVRTGSEIVIIQPPPGPVRTRPENAGGETQ